MSTGRKTLRENTRERVVSSDINRLQTFEQADSNDILATQVLQPTDDSLYVGTTFPPGTTPLASFAVFKDTVTAPAYGTILEGLMVIVPTAGLSLIVTPGLALIIDPDGQPGSTTPTPPNPDDSVSKLVRGLGVPLGALPWTPNGGAGIRVDVVEIQRSDTVTETDNRDIFNPATGLFTAQSVTKVTDGQVSYRIRLGAAGGGLPVPALGWLPIAVLSTPVGALDLDAVSVWDVRNLATDVATPSTVRQTALPHTERARWLIDVTTGGEVRLSGESVVNVLGQRAGGLFINTATGTAYLRLDLPQFQAAGFALIASSLLYVYALFPTGYSRWVGYYFTPTATVGGRVPGPYRGVIAISHIPAIDGIPTAPIAPPLITGLGGSTLLATVLATTVTDTLAAINGSAGDSVKTYINGVGSTGLSWLPVAGLVVIPGPPTIIINFTFAPGVHFPVGATRIRVIFSVLFDGLIAPGNSNTLTRQVLLQNTASTLYYLATDIDRRALICDGVTNGHDGFTMELPAISDGISQPSGPIAVQVKYAVTVGNIGALAFALSASATVAGYSFDP